MPDSDMNLQLNIGYHISISSVFRYESLHLSLRYAHLSQKSRYSFPVYIHHSAGLALVRSIFLFAHLCCLVMRIFVYDTPFFQICAIAGTALVFAYPANFCFRYEFFCLYPLQGFAMIFLPTFIEGACINMPIVLLLKDT